MQRNCVMNNAFVDINANALCCLMGVVSCKLPFSLAKTGFVAETVPIAPFGTPLA